MTTDPNEERLREIERDQEGLRASIDDTRRLSEKVQQLLERRRAKARSE